MAVTGGSELHFLSASQDSDVFSISNLGLVFFSCGYDDYQSCLQLRRLRVAGLGNSSSGRGRSRLGLGVSALGSGVPGLGAWALRISGRGVEVLVRVLLRGRS